MQQELNSFPGPVPGNSGVRSVQGSPLVVQSKIVAGPAGWVRCKTVVAVQPVQSTTVVAELQEQSRTAVAGQRGQSRTAVAGQQVRNTTAGAGQPGRSRIAEELAVTSSRALVQSKTGWVAPGGHHMTVEELVLEQVQATKTNQIIWCMTIKNLNFTYS